MKYFISAGHTPTKPGACDDGFCEHDEAVRWVDLVCKHLKEMSQDYFIVPTGSISHKAKFINGRANKKDVAIEIHFNSYAPQYGYHKKVEGCETLYYPTSERGKKAAKVVQDSMLATSRFTEDRGIKEGWYQQDKDKGVIFILKKTVCTCLIVEPEFIQHKQEIIAMRDDVAEGIAEGLVLLQAHI